MNEQAFWTWVENRAEHLRWQMNEIATTYRMSTFNYTLSGPAKRELEWVQKEAGRMLAEDAERERGRNAA